MDKILPQNESTFDRVIRVVLGVALISLVFVGPQTLFGWFGLIPLATGLVGSCPLYRMFGINTKRHDTVSRA
jgi:membrane protein implicated in regulation of membrane protease activity